MPCPKACKNCKYWDAPNNVLGRRMVRKGASHPCVAPLPDPPTLPACIKVDAPSHHWAGLGVLFWPPKGRPMLPGEGSSCAYFTPRN